jgi:lipopolysaccharide transport system ATP-binding protein
MQPAIVVNNLAKAYRLRHKRGPYYKTLRETLHAALTLPWRRIHKLSSHATNAPFWAVRDLTFEIEPGSVVGIIGRNGAGKSTLLKILSRITEPTHGSVTLRGHLGSLLEVGTGFHPELTGRENVYLNGAILGMTRRQISRQFDAIVSFAQIDEFLDTPVKHYSSGMYVRLAFAVATHLDPEILLVDEVLAVGDATYQRRCINRMAELANSGKTVLFVSHNMDLIPRLCKSAILLENGHMRMRGPAHEVVNYYLSQDLANEESDDLAGKSRIGDGRACFSRLQLLGGDGGPTPVHRFASDLVLRFDLESKCHVNDVALAVVLKTLSGTRVITSWTKEANFHVSLIPGKHTYQCTFKNVRVRPGHRLTVMLWMESQGVMDCIENARVIDVTDGIGSQHLSTEQSQGVVVFDYAWSHVSSQPAQA